jgi:hypothetical protein
VAPALMVLQLSDLSITVVACVTSRESVMTSLPVSEALLHDIGDLDDLGGSCRSGPAPTGYPAFVTAGPRDNGHLPKKERCNGSDFEFLGRANINKRVCSRHRSVCVWSAR